MNIYIYIRSVCRQQLFCSLKAHQYSSDQKKILRDQSAQTNARVVSISYPLCLPFSINRELNLRKLRNVILRYIYIYIYTYIYYIYYSYIYYICILYIYICIYIIYAYKCISIKRFSIDNILKVCHNNLYLTLTRRASIF